LENKHTLAVSSVGAAGGKSVNRKFLGLQDVCRTRLSDFLFYTVGIPTRVDPLDKKEELEDSADRLIRNIENHTPKRAVQRISDFQDRIIMEWFLLKRSPEAYSHVIESWKAKGYL
jgi:hypothetical protein